MSYLIIVRHGDTALNEEHKNRGWRDVPLSPKGEKEAEKMGNELKGKPIDTIHTSDLKRARKTAEIISNKIGIPVSNHSKDLRPWDIGDLSGMDIEETLPKLQMYVSRLADKQIPGGESFNVFKNRFLNGLTKILKENIGKNVLIVTHHRGERLTKAWMDKGMPSDFSIKDEVMKTEGIKPGTFIIHKKK